ncbi:MAG: glycoside hydrolase family 2 TIM barrel-domain containing protein [Anaerolineae bacterium]|nr:glycoside hydrolase family 2 TIM barrel-domain containing protein [Anaerolineae bacterium]
MLDLSTLSWELGWVPPRPWRDTAGADAAYDLVQAAEWLPATVPGDVHSDLLAAGRIPDPYRRDGLRACRWVDEVDWWYRTRLPLGLPPGRRAFLELDGVDYLSAVFVDGRELSRHQGMFSRQTVEIPPDLAVRPTAELAVRLWGSHALPRYALSRRQRLWARVVGPFQHTFRPFDDRLATLKAPMQFGWDFAPRLLAVGIWDAARLALSDAAYLADLWLQAEPLTPAADPTPARLRVQFTVDAPSSLGVRVHLAVQPHNFEGEGWDLDFAVTLPAGRSVQDLAVTLPAARRWQPWERGAAHLYTAQLTLYGGDGSGSALAGRSAIFGVRSLRWPDADRGGWRLLVNGQPFYLRGANWVPVDSLRGRAQREDYARLLEMARSAGVNCLRVWGGGGREKAAFYDLCDELGLLVWQEFPIACVFLDHLPRTAAYRHLLRQEAAGMVRALRNHPSLMLWCGGNEFSPRRNRAAVETLAEVAAAEDGSRRWLPASPGPGDAHHWLVWHGFANLAAYREERAAMVSEFGLQAAPAVESLRRFLDADELWPPGAGWQRHKGDLPKLQRYARYFDDPDADPEGGSEPLAAFVAASQRSQAAGLQIMVEHLRRRRWSGQEQAVPAPPHASAGLAVWQWNDPWPAISWSVVDYFGRPKLAYHVLRRVLQPVLVSLEYPLRPYRPGDRLRGALWVVNDGLQPLKSCRLLAWLDEAPVHAGEVAVPAAAAVAVGALDLTLPPGFRALRLALRQGNALLAENVYDLRFHDAGPTSLVHRLRRKLVDWTLR